MSVDAAVRGVRSAAGSSPDWDSLAAAARQCAACPELVATRTSVVVGVRPARTSLLLVGEAPGATEDASGLPFVGRAGAVLDEALSEAGLARDDVGVVNVLKCRPPGNRAPSRSEMARCTGWLHRQLELVEPAVIVTLGGTAAAWAFGRATKLADVRGRAHRPVGAGGRVVVPTYHPSAALRFGPRGEPRRLLALDLALAAGLLAAPQSL